MGKAKRELRKIRNQLLPVNALKRKNNEKPLKAVLYKGEVVVRETIFSEPKYQPKGKNTGIKKSIYNQIIKKLIVKKIDDMIKTITNPLTGKPHNIEIKGWTETKEKHIVINHGKSSTAHSFDRNKRRKRNREARQMRAINA